jgi:Spy/CpxP family protein refolding chaperone
MKKALLLSGIVIISFLFISQQLFAQRYYRNGPDLTQEQMEKMNKLELELEKELSSLFSKLRNNYMKLDELELQRNPDYTRTNKIWETIYKLEEEIEKKEISHETKIRGLLTKDQMAVLDSYYGYGMGAGRGYFGGGRGRGRMGQGYARFGSSYGTGYGRNYLRRDTAWQGQGYYGRGIGARRLDRGNYRYYSRVRYGRGPCGAGWGKWSTQGYGRGR